MKTMIYLFLLVGITSCSHKPQNTESRTVAIEKTETKEQSMEDLYGDGFLVGNDKLQLGEFSDDDTITCKFTFINQGSEPIEILEYSVSCNCTALDYKRDAMMVNDTIVFAMVIYTKDKKAGEHSSKAIIKTNGRRRYYDLAANFTVK